MVLSFLGFAPSLHWGLPHLVEGWACQVRNTRLGPLLVVTFQHGEKWCEGQLSNMSFRGSPGLTTPIRALTIQSLCVLFQGPTQSVELNWGTIICLSAHFFPNLTTAFILPLQCHLRQCMRWLWSAPEWRLCEVIERLVLQKLFVVNSSLWFFSPIKPLKQRTPTPPKILSMSFIFLNECHCQWALMGE